MNPTPDELQKQKADLILKKECLIEQQDLQLQGVDTKIALIREQIDSFFEEEDDEKPSQKSIFSTIKEVISGEKKVISTQDIYIPPAVREAKNKLEKLENERNSMVAIFLEQTSKIEERIKTLDTEIIKKN